MYTLSSKNLLVIVDLRVSVTISAIDIDPGCCNINALLAWHLVPLLPYWLIEEQSYIISSSDTNNTKHLPTRYYVIATQRLFVRDLNNNPLLLCCCMLVLNKYTHTLGPYSELLFLRMSSLLDSHLSIQAELRLKVVNTGGIDSSSSRG